MIKAAFFDVDGTLMSHKSHSVPRSARLAIEKLREAGILCVLATGRNYSELQKLPVSELEFDAYVLMTGQIVVDGNGERRHAMPISGEVKDFIVQAYRNQTFPIFLAEENCGYLNFVNDHVRAVQAAISSPIPDILPYTGGDIYQASVYLTREEEQVLAPIVGKCEMARWNSGGVDIIEKGGGKVRGIACWLELMGLKREEIIAFGDGENDEGMLRFAGIGVAMGNAVAVTKAAADYVTTDVDDDGIYNAVRYFDLIG